MSIRMLGKPLAWVLLFTSSMALALQGCQRAERPVEQPAGGEAAQTGGADTGATPGAAQAGGDTATPSGGAEARGPEGAGAGGFVLKEAGFQTPESVLHDEAADVYLVSNINGNPFEKDDNGFISRVSPEGRVLELKWIDGAREDVTLHSPKGLAIHGDSLFVADIDSVRVFDRRSGEPLAALGLPGASFLNDLATGPDGKLYVTDTGIRAPAAGGQPQPAGTDALYRFDGGRAVAVAKGKELGGPNGVAVDDRGPVVVTFGSGKIFRVGQGGKLEELAAPPTGQLDGVVLLGESGMIVTSWEGKAVYHITTTGEVHKVWEDIDSPADLGYDFERKRMIVPSFNGNFVEARTTH